MDDNGSRAVRNNDDGHGMLKVISWLALILALLALGLAYMAYNRAGQNLSTDVKQGVNQAQDAAGDAANQAEQEAKEAGQAIDAGPDGVDEDDTDTGTGTTPAPGTAPRQ